MGINDKDYIQKIAEDVKENPDISLRLVKRFLPLAIVLFMAGLLWFYFTHSDHKCRSFKEKISQNVNPTLDSISIDSEGQAAMEVWSKTLGGNVELSLPNGNKLSVPQNGVENSLLKFLIQDCPGDLKASWFNCDRLLFKSGSAELNSASLDQLEDLASLMKSFPKSKFKIGGYTDNSGNAGANKKLSEDRAAKVLQTIIENGVPAESITSEGYGSEHPVCPANDTDECKAKNRRVAIRIEKCN